jgi:hypothetical protein
MIPTRNQLKKRADQTYQNLKRCLGIPEELAFTELYRQEKENAEDGLDLRLEKARITEDSLKRTFQEHMPNGVIYGEDGRLYILPPADSVPETIEEAEEQQLDNLSEWPGGFPLYAQEDMVTSAQAKCLIVFFFAWMTTYWFGWRPFILSTSITCVTFWFLDHIIGLNFIL